MPRLSILIFIHIGHPNLTNITAPPTGDAFVRNGTAFRNTNFGKLDYLLVSQNFSDPSATRYSYFEFDLFCKYNYLVIEETSSDELF